MKADIFSIHLKPVIDFVVREYPFPEGMLREFPWRPQYERLKELYTRNMLAITLGGKPVGGMVTDFSEPEPALIFFEVARELRGQGIGRHALNLLVDRLRGRGYARMFVQTGRPQIYDGMGYAYEPVDGGLYLDLSYPWASAEPAEVPLTIIYHPDYLRYDLPRHPESPQRISYTLSYLHVQGVLRRLGHLFPEEAREEELLLVHTPEHLARVREASEKRLRFDYSTVAFPETYRIASLAYGGALLAAKEVERGKLKKLFVLARPPGHHAEPSAAKGFCFFNNAAGAAMYLFKKGMRVAILDWDAHHGDGTQAVFWRLPVLYISIHQRYLYPYTGEPDERGEGPGLGYTVNLPVPPGSGWRDYAPAFEAALEALTSYRPDVIIVSAGQDGHREDTATSLMLTEEDYGRMAAAVARLANEEAGGRLILVLEGGYNPRALSKSIFQITKSLLGYGGNV